MSNLAQRSLGGGEIAPGLFARTDSIKYQTGLRTCRNFIVQKFGGVVNRPGTDYILPTKMSGVARFLKFVFNDEQTYVLEFGDKYIRFIQRGAPVLVTGPDWVIATEYAVGDIINSQDDVLFYATVAHTSSALDEPGHGGNWPTLWTPLLGGVLELPTPYLVADLALLQYVQSGNTITLVHPDYPPYDLIRTDARWTLDKAVFGPALPPPSNLLAVGTGTIGNVYYAVTSVQEDTLEESLAALFSYNHLPSETNPNTITWEGVPGAISYNVYRSYDAVTYGLINAAGGLPSGIEDATWVATFDTATATGTVIGGWTGVAGVDLRNTLTMTIFTRAYDNNYTYKIRGTLTPSVGASGISKGKVLITARPTGGFFGGAGPFLSVGESIEFTTVDDFENGPFEIEGTFHLPVAWLGYTGLEVRIQPLAQAPSVSGTVDFTVDATTPPDNTITWLNQVVGFGDVGADADYGSAPPSDPGLFKADDDFPRAAGYYQQRRFFASSNSEPLKVWGSQVGRFNNFGRSTPLIDSDGVSFTMVGPQANSPRHMLDLGKLMILTMGGEMKIDGDDAGIIRPDAINPTSAGENGIRANIRPLKVVDSMVYVQARGNIVRTLRPVQSQGGTSNYEGTELSIMAAHLFRGKTIVDWDYSKSPNSIVWVVRSDGILLGLTYLPEHGLWGWHRHDTDGFVESVICVPEDDEDRVYLIVRRTIDGSTVRYIERMAQRYFGDDIADAHFMDCAQRYNGMNALATTVTLSTAAGWTAEDEITATFSVASITAGDIGKGIFIPDADGRYLKFLIQEFISTTVAQGIVDRTVPLELRTTPTAVWGIAVNTLDGLEHLEGKAVSILGDGYVVANPSNPDTEVVEVVGGVASWDELYVNVLIGLPYLSDLQTLDIDTPSGPSVKEKKILVDRVGLYVEESRGIWAGRPNTPTADDPLKGLQEFKARDDEEWGDPNALITDFIEIPFESNWDKDGRIFIRQIDPLPLSVLSITPMGTF